MTIKEKKQRIQPKPLNMNIQKQCEMIGLPRSCYSHEGLAKQESPENHKIMKLIDKEYTDHPFYGSREIRNVYYEKVLKLTVNGFSD